MFAVAAILTRFISHFGHEFMTIFTRVTEVELLSIIYMYTIHFVGIAA